MARGTPGTYITENTNTNTAPNMAEALSTVMSASKPAYLKIAR
jgi:hypothetical protein